MQNFALLILMFGAVGVMMVFGSRNKKKQALKAQELQASIVPGTRVMTTSGLHATVTAVDDTTIELEIAPGVYTTWLRAAVREIVVAAPEEDAYDDTEYDESEYTESDFTNPTTTNCPVRTSSSRSMTTTRPWTSVRRWTSAATTSARSAKPAGPGQGRQTLGRNRSSILTNFGVRAEGRLNAMRR